MPEETGQDVNPAAFEVSDTQGRMSPDHRVIYVNSSRMGLSPWDVRLILGQVIESEPGLQVNEDLVTIVTSPQHAKAIARSLLQVVATYEKTFGEIPDVQKTIKEAKAAKSKKS